MSFWTTKRVTITGGAGFLGREIVRLVQEEGCREVFVPRSREYDLVDGGAVRRMLDDSRPELVIHLAARVGGIGANRANPGRFFYDNLMMGVQLMEEARQAAASPKFVAVGTICAYPKFTPVPFREDDLWDGYPEETNAPYGLAKKMLLVQAQAYRQQYGFNAIYLLPVNLYGPRRQLRPGELARHPGPDHASASRRRDRGDAAIEVWGDGSPTREFLYVEDAAGHRAGRRAVRRGGAGQPRLREGDLHQGSGELIAELTGFRGEIVWDTSKPNGQPRRSLDTSRAEQLFGFQARTPLRVGLQRTVSWYEMHRR